MDISVSVLVRRTKVQDAIAKGTDDAKKSLIFVPIFKGTIPHSVIGKFGAGKVMLKPASPGTGLIAGGGVPCCAGNGRCERRAHQANGFTQFSQCC